MHKLSKEEYLASLRRRSSGFSRGVSKYRGVAKHHRNGRWEARIGRVSGNKYLYVGTFGTQEEAAAAYDIAAIEYRGPNAVTNFDISNYTDKLKTIIPPQILQPKHEEETDKVQPDKAHPMLSNPKLEPIDRPIIMVGPGTEEHPWDVLYLDTGFDSFPLLDIPLEKEPELLGWLDEVGLEEDIECIFDGVSFCDDGFIPDAMSGTVGFEAGEDALTGRDLSTSTSSSSLSTMASVCSNV